MARQIAPDFRDRPVTIVGVLTGSLMFLADLVRHLDLPLRIALIQASSYRGATTTAGELHIQPELLPELRGRHILLLDDILDTGQTLSHLRAHICQLGIASIKVAVLLRKRGRQNVGESEGAMVRKVRVQGDGRIVRRGWCAWIEQHNRAARGHGEANRSQENYRDPQESYESRIRMHRPIPRLL